jgi:hypothetical protein
VTAEQAQQIIQLLENGPPTQWWPFLLVPIATALGAVLGVAAASFAIVTQRSISKRKNTLDVIMQFESDPVYRAAVRTYRQFREGRITVDALLEPRTDADQTYKDHMNTFWNWHEAVALGIRRDTLDDEILMRWWGEPMVVTWNHSVVAINRFRKVNNTKRQFKNYEVVAREFARRLQKISALPPAFKEPEQRNALPFRLRDRWFGLRPPPIAE